MAANISCQRVLATEQCHEVVVVFPKSLRTRFVEFWSCWGRSLRTGFVEFWSFWGRLLWLVCLVIFGLLAGIIIFSTFIAFVTMAVVWIPVIVTEHCHKEPGIELRNFNIHDMTAFRNVSTPDSPWQVNTHFNATFSTRNRNTVTKCFTTYRRMDVRVEYRGQVILQQQYLPLGFSLKPHARRNFSIEMKGDHVQLKKDLGPVMQAEMRSGNITLNFFFDTRYLRADRKSNWESNGCVVIANSSSDSPHLKTMVDQDCYTF